MEIGQPELGSSSSVSRALVASQLELVTQDPTARGGARVAADQPTLLLDETDAIFGPKARDREDLRGMLNAGYRRGAVAWRMGGANNTTLEAFPVYCAKAFAGIGSLPDTLADRSAAETLHSGLRKRP